VTLHLVEEQKTERSQPYRAVEGRLRPPEVVPG
jgi:hypothetical protein